MIEHESCLRYLPFSQALKRLSAADCVLIPHDPSGSPFSVISTPNTPFSRCTATHHTTMSNIAHDTAFETLDALEQRLQRVRFLLYGTSTATDPNDNDKTSTDTPVTQSIASRLQALQSSLNSVLSDSQSARDIVTLRNICLSHDMSATRLTLD